MSETESDTDFNDTDESKDLDFIFFNIQDEIEDENDSFENSDSNF